MVQKLSVNLFPPLTMTLSLFLFLFYFLFWNNYHFTGNCKEMNREVPCNFYTSFPNVDIFIVIVKYQNQEIDLDKVHRAYSHFLIYTCIHVCVYSFMQLCHICSSVKLLPQSRYKSVWSAQGFLMLPLYRYC